MKPDKPSNPAAPPPRVSPAPRRRAGVLVWVLALALTFVLVRGLAHAAQWPWLYAVLVLPGTVLHEAAHAGMAWLLGAQPQGFSLWPQRMTDGSWLLGSVQFVPTAWNVASIALAPLGLLGVALAGVALAVQARRWSWRLLGVYGAACAVSSCWPSAVDWGLAWRAPLSWPLALVWVLLGVGLLWGWLRHRIRAG